MITYHKIQVEDCNVFYREAGSSEKPTILLLHGFPSSSHMFRELMPELSDNYHLIAPDFPAFGQTESPSREEFIYSFDHLARISAPISPLCWPYGVRTIHRSFLPEPKPSSATCPMLKSISYPAVTSHLKVIMRRLPN